MCCLLYFDGFLRMVVCISNNKVLFINPGSNFVKEINTLGLLLIKKKKEKVFFCGIYYAF